MFGLLQNFQKNTNSAPEDCDSEASADLSANRLNNITSNASFFAGKIAQYAKLASDVAHERVNKISTILNENTILSELERQNQNFKSELQTETQSLPREVVLPWEGAPNVDALRKHILALSLEERNFLDEAPSDVMLQSEQKIVAQKLLALDARLSDMRYKLVPKKISEENFWKNYFYRISILKKLAADKQKDDVALETSSAESPSSSDQETTKPKASVAEANENASEKQKEETLTTSEEDWERELLQEISEFELVGGNGAQKSDAEWDAEIRAIIEAESASQKANETKKEPDANSDA